jgi:hypothetical protein
VRKKGAGAAKEKGRDKRKGNGRMDEVKKVSQKERGGQWKRGKRQTER